jgi:glycosyl hydrolase family 16
VSRRRSKLPLFALAVLAAAALPAAAAAFPIGSASLPHRVAARSATTAVVREHVGSAGVYDLKVTVATRATDRRFLDVEVGPLSRRARIDPHTDRATMRLLLTINRSSFTLRVRGSQAGVPVRTTLVRVGALVRGTAPGAIALAVAADANGSTKASGVETKPGASGATGATGASGTTSPPAAIPTPAPAPVTPPLSATFAPDGAPILALPNGFAPIVSYTNLVKDYEFTGSSLPADWSASANSAHGMETMYQPSQVSMTGSAVALTAINQPDDGYPTTSGWISTEGQYSITHGLIDFRAKMPAGQGLWSGLWLDQPDNYNPWGELDVQEMLLNDTHTVYGSAHGWAPSQWGETQSTVMSADASQGYHDYQLSWQPGLLTWAVDGIAYAQYTQAQATASGYPWPFDDGTGFYLIATLAVGTANEWPGAPNASTQFPASMDIQSVKVWQ